jgi:hypothetical protein
VLLDGIYFDRYDIHDVILYGTYMVSDYEL